MQEVNRSENNYKSSPFYWTERTSITITADWEVVVDAQWTVVEVEVVNLLLPVDQLSS
jgi:hypothetical protein